MTKPIDFIYKKAVRIANNNYLSFRGLTREERIKTIYANLYHKATNPITPCTTKAMRDNLTRLEKLLEAVQ